jgi:hypothetical protein
MSHSPLTISFQRGRKGTIIGKIVELPHISIRGTSLEEVRSHLLAALTSRQSS